MKGIRKPQSAPREKWVTPEEFRAIVDEIMGQPKHRHGFALYLASLYYSGARPGELAAARIGDYDGQTITLSTWKNYSKTGKKRRIYLETRGKVAIAKAIGDRTDKTDLIFKDSRGGQIHRDSVRNRLNRIVRKLGMDENIVAYSFRHAYAVRGLRSGIAISTLAELMGTSVDQIERVYGHRAEHTDMLASEALRIR